MVEYDYPCDESDVDGDRVDSYLATYTSTPDQ